VRIAAIRVSEPDACGRHKPECLMALRSLRDRLVGVDWKNADSVRIVNDVATERILNLDPPNCDLTR
jgi:hypothetical protein